MDNLYKKDFPILLENNISYLDSAATAQKPLQVINAINNYYKKYNAKDLKIIDNTFAIGDTSSAPFYLMNNEIVDLYIEGFKKIADNIDQIVEYCNNEEIYISPYSGIVGLSDTKGVFI